MNNAFEIIRLVEAEGGFLGLSDDCLYLWVEQEHMLSFELMESLLEHRELVIEVLRAAHHHPRRKVWKVQIPDYQFTLIGPPMSHNQALAIARWRWGNAEIID